MADQLSARTVTATASRRLSFDDQGRCLDAVSTAAITIDVPTIATVAWPVDTEIEICREGTGRVIIAAASGVSLRGVRGTAASFEIPNQYGVVVLKKKNDNEWRIAGDFV